MRRSSLTAIVAMLGLVATACGSSAKTSATLPTTTAAASFITAAAATTAPSATTVGSSALVKQPAGKDISIAVITNGDDQEFWSLVRQGTEAAGRDLGITVRYQGANNNPDEEARMVDQAVTDNASGIALSVADTPGLTAAALRATASGRPLVTMNSGIRRSKELGAITHIGQSELDAGRGAGERLKAGGATSLLCILPKAKGVGLVERCRGVVETFSPGKVLELALTSDAPDVIEAEIYAKLAASPSIDAVLATGPFAARSTVSALATLNRKATIGAIDVSPDLLALIQDGAVSFTIDLQPYLQGYLSVVTLCLTITNKTPIGGAVPIANGSFIDKSNVAAVIEQVGKG